MGNKKNRNKFILPSPSHTVSVAPKVPIGSYTLSAQQVKQIQVHSGPLPAPITLEQYEKIIPGAAERILAMAEKQVSHRIALEAEILPLREKQSSRGQIFAFIVCLIMLGISALAIICKQSIVALTIFSITLVSVIALFLKAKQIPLLQKQPQEKQPEQK